MLFKEGIADNLRFMVLEVTRQLENTMKQLESPSLKLVASISSRDDYIDNLKSVIEDKCFSSIYRLGQGQKRTVDLMRAVTTVAANLERIADFAVNVVAQTAYLKTPEFIHRYEYRKFFKEVLGALDLVYKAVMNQDMSLAFRICRSEFTLDALYKVQFDRILTELRSGMETENLITSHLILRYLERMGDSLLNIGEAIIFAAVGEKFKIRQYEALKENLAKSGVEIPLSDVEFQSIWGTRSGCRIGRVSKVSRGEDARPSAGVLFKEGDKKKLLKEKENFERWEAIMPGLPPRVLAHQQEDEQASLLIEFLGGCTLQDVILAAEPDIVRNAFFLVEQTLTAIWDQTKSLARADADYLGQIRSRLDDVYRLNPSLEGCDCHIGGLRLASLESLLERVEPVAAALHSPYGVFTHGDFNINNVVYDHENQAIHYVDLHRSKMTDPLQDIGVFVVSNFRMPIFDKPMRGRLNWAGLQMYRYAATYARGAGDTAFHARLALSLARNFITSVRFELNPRFARVMFLRGMYLLERLTQHHGQPWEDFRFPHAVMTY
ncbi:MAG: PhoU domain-containing protein [Desulfovibrionaceae bacterium]